MTFDEYQRKAHETAIYPPENALEYLALGLCSEAGEVAGKVKKIIRGDRPLGFAAEAEIAAEVMDIVWYAAELLTFLGRGMSIQARANLDKLAARKAKGTLHGSGDSR